MPNDMGHWDRWQMMIRVGDNHIMVVLEAMVDTKVG